MEIPTWQKAEMFCLCGNKFKPAYRNGILISKSCPNCQYKLAYKSNNGKNGSTHAEKDQCLKSPKKRVKTNFNFYTTTAWKWFSRYVLLYYANKDFAVQCSTSGRWMSITSRKSQCGHYIKVRDMTKTNYSVAFDFRNVAPQSLQDNKFGGGRQDEMRKWLVMVHGEESIKELEIKKNQICRLDKTELDYWAKIYRAKFNELLTEKQIKNPWTKRKSFKVKTLTQQTG
jgi:hypothetical protein